MNKMNKAHKHMLLSADTSETWASAWKIWAEVGMFMFAQLCWVRDTSVSCRWCLL